MLARAETPPGALAEAEEEDEASPLLAPAPPENRHPMYTALSKLARLNTERGVVVEPMPQQRYHSNY